MSPELIAFLLIVGQLGLVAFAALHVLVLLAREQCNRLEVLAALGGIVYLGTLFSEYRGWLDPQTARALLVLGMGWTVAPYIAPLVERVFKPKNKERGGQHAP